MFVISSGIKNGKIEDKYGKQGKIENDMPILSLPFEIKEATKSTRCFAVVFDDPDAQAVCGFTWIHWLIANLRIETVEEGSSQTSSELIQGKNSWGYDCYGGPAPPNAPHKYILRVYALNKELPLRKGFSFNELKNYLTKEYIIDSCQLSGWYDN